MLVLLFSLLQLRFTFEPFTSINLDVFIKEKIKEQSKAEAPCWSLQAGQSTCDSMTAALAFLRSHQMTEHGRTSREPGREGTGGCELAGPEWKVEGA